uniref:PadR family transcriptional regulator n=1 Tax=Ignisphaera aggregans TaxID=334771 RepID=A0A7C5XK11_9CREN
MFRPTPREFELNTLLIILYVLSKGPAHGYEIMKRIKEEFFFHKSPGILYPSLKKLLTLGYIDAVAEDQRGKKLLKVYRITNEGIKFLSNHIDRVEHLKKISRGLKIFEDVGGYKIREAIFKLVEVLPYAKEDNLKMLSITINDFVKSLENLRNTIMVRGG